MPELKRPSSLPQEDLPLSPENRRLIRQFIRRELEEALVPIQDYLSKTKSALGSIVDQLQAQGQDLETLSQDVDFLRVMVNDLLQSPYDA